MLLPHFCHDGRARGWPLWGRSAMMTGMRSIVTSALAFAGFAALTMLVAGLTWQGWLSLFLVVASLLSTYSMFYMRGAPLRWVMLLVSMLWMVNAWTYGSWEQVAANAATGAAALYAAWRTARTQAR